VGTINIVVRVPVRLSGAALVNAVATATEAKVQALHETGVRATGTASDAIVVHCPTDGAAETYGGPRSAFGARIARAVHAAVLTGARFWISGPRDL
jgi:adenosylcobinamide hydrolase